jgi:hypothetical protein
MKSIRIILAAIALSVGFAAPALAGNGPECWDADGKWVWPVHESCQELVDPDWPGPSTSVVTTTTEAPTTTVATTTTTVEATTTTVEPTTTTTVPALVVSEPSTTTTPTSILSDPPLPPDTTVPASTTTVLDESEVMPPFITPTTAPPATLPVTGFDPLLLVYAAMLIIAGLIGWAVEGAPWGRKR